MNVQWHAAGEAVDVIHGVGVSGVGHGLLNLPVPGLWYMLWVRWPFQGAPCSFIVKLKMVPNFSWNLLIGFSCVF